MWSKKGEESAKRVLGRLMSSCRGARIERADGWVQIGVDPFLDRVDGRLVPYMLRVILDNMMYRGCYYSVDFVDGAVEDGKRRARFFVASDGVEVILVDRPGVKYDVKREDSGCKKEGKDA